MFGRTRVPQKGGPTKGVANFLHARNTEIMGNPRVKVASFSGELTHGRTTVMTKKRSPVFFRGEGPHIFFEQGPTEGKPSLAQIHAHEFNHEAAINVTHQKFLHYIRQTQVIQQLEMPVHYNDAEIGVR